MAAARQARVAWRRHACARACIARRWRRLWRGKLIGLHRAAWSASRGFAEWHGIVAARWDARLSDHRMTMVGAGFVTLARSASSCSARCRMTFFPPQNDDFCAGQHHAGRRARRSSRPRPSSTGSRRHRRQGPRRRARVRARQRRQRPRQHRAQEGPRSHQHRVRARRWPRTLAAIPDARVNFQSQNGGGPDADARDIMLYLGGDDPETAERGRQQDRQGNGDACPDLRAPRVGGDLARPEITIKPRFDLAADLGVTTAALSQTIRIATIGDIEQNSAKFSLADRQVPITVSLVGKRAARPGDARESAGADHRAAARCR